MKIKQIRNENEKRKIISLYESGLNHKQIGELYKMSENGICSLLRRKGIKSHKNISGNRNPNYKGGFTYKEGRKIIRIDGKNIYEYRYIMEQYIGRKLKKGEIVHHINGDIADNRIENLKLMKIGEHIKLHISLGDIFKDRKGTSKFNFIYDTAQEYNRLYRKTYYKNNREKILKNCRIKYMEKKNVS